MYGAAIEGCRIARWYRGCLAGFRPAFGVKCAMQEQKSRDRTVAVVCFEGLLVGVWLADAIMEKVARGKDRRLGWSDPMGID